MDNAAIGESPSARPEDISIFAYPNRFSSSVTISIYGSKSAEISNAIASNVLDIATR